MRTDVPTEPENCPQRDKEVTGPEPRERVSGRAWRWPLTGAPLEGRAGRGESVTQRLGWSGFSGKTEPRGEILYIYIYVFFSVFIIRGFPIVAHR